MADIDFEVVFFSSYLENLMDKVMPVVRVHEGIAHAVFPIKVIGETPTSRVQVGWYPACEDVGIAMIRAGGRPYATLILLKSPVAAVVTCMCCIAAGEG